jgi:DNA invertase Pin-like site-specific DNA recombinase
MKPNAKRAAFYLRVSTHEQTTANQIPALEQIARARGLEVVEVFKETESAAKARPEFDRMMQAAHRGEFGTLLIWALDRLGRSMIGNVQDVTKLDRWGVNVISYTESWLELGGPMRGLILAIFSTFAEAERSRLIERTIAGQARARAEGKSIGRPRARVDVNAVDEAIARLHKRDGRAPSHGAVAKAIGISRASYCRWLARDRAAAHIGCDGQTVSKVGVTKPRAK